MYVCKCMYNDTNICMYVCICACMCVTCVSVRCVCTYAGVHVHISESPRNSSRIGDRQTRSRSVSDCVLFVSVHNNSIPHYVANRIRRADERRTRSFSGRATSYNSFAILAILGVLSHVADTSHSHELRAHITYCSNHSTGLTSVTCRRWRGEGNIT